MPVAPLTDPGVRFARTGLFKLTRSTAHKNKGATLITEHCALIQPQQLPPGLPRLLRFSPSCLGRSRNRSSPGRTPLNLFSSQASHSVLLLDFHAFPDCLYIESSRQPVQQPARKPARHTPERQPKRTASDHWLRCYVLARHAVGLSPRLVPGCPGEAREAASSCLSWRK